MSTNLSKIDACSGDVTDGSVRREKLPAFYLNNKKAINKGTQSLFIDLSQRIVRIYRATLSVHVQNKQNPFSACLQEGTIP